MRAHDDVDRPALERLDDAPGAERDLEQASSFASIVITTSAPAHASATDDATCAPRRASSAVFSGVRFQTVSALPPSRTRPAIAEPILPMPMKPTRIACSLPDAPRMRRIVKHGHVL